MPCSIRSIPLPCVACANRALIGLMVYTLARINAVLQMKVADYYSGAPWLGPIA